MQRERSRLQSQMKNIVVFASVLLLFVAAEVHGQLDGVVIEEVAQGSVLERAGLQAGDVLTRWIRLPVPPANPRMASGELVSPFEWRWLVVEQAPRGSVRLLGARDGEALEVLVEPGVWGAEVRPVLSESWLELYRRGHRLIDEGAPVAGLKLWRALAGRSAGAGRRRLASWFELRRGEVWSENRAWEKAHAALVSGLEEARDPLSRSILWEARCAVAYEEGDVEHSRSFCRRSLEILEASWGQSLAAAKVRYLLGEVERAAGGDAGHFEELGGIFREVLEVRRQLAPGSLPVAEALAVLGALSLEEEDLEAAEKSYGEALEIYERFVPESLLLTGVLDGLSTLALRRGDLTSAEMNELRGLKVRRKLAPGTRLEAESLDRLGSLARSQGQLGLALERFQSALAIWEVEEPRSLRVAVLLNNLGLLAGQCGRFELAEAYSRRSFHLHESREPGGFHSAVVLNNLAELALRQGQLEDSEELYQRSLELHRGRNPESLDAANSLYHLGNVARLRGDLEAAQRFLKDSLALYQAQAPEGLAMAANLHALGTVARTQGAFEEAEQFYLRALALRQRWLPGGLDPAETLAALAELEIDRRQPERASEWLRRAMDSLAAPDGPTGDSRQRALYRRAVEVELGLGRPEAAFAILERQTQAAGFSARSLLGPGMVLLAYNLGERRSHLFVLDSEGRLEVHELLPSPDTLRREVRLFRRWIAAQAEGTEAARKNLEEMGERLYGSLLAPAADRLETSEAVFILPDGPLEFLPFTALVRRGEDGDPQNLASWRTVRLAPWLTDPESSEVWPPAEGIPAACSSKRQRYGLESPLR